MQKGFLDTFRQLDADFFCLQETKLQPGQIQLDTPGYTQFWCSAQKKGYSGTAIFAKTPPLSVQYGLGVEELDQEGRMITLEYQDFYLVTCYTPNAQEGLKRLDHRLAWDQAFREKLTALAAQKPVVACGDLNVAHQEIDLEESRPQPGQHRILRRGAGELHPPVRRRLHRYLPAPVPGSDRGLQLVELPLQRPEKQRRMAD